MIRTLVTAHINSLDLHELTIQINDRSLGYLTTQKQQNYVASTNRRVQMITGIRTDRLDQNLIVESRDMLRKWSAVFRELQIYGLDILPSILNRDQLHAEFLFLIHDEVAIALLSRHWGFYLQRGGRLYRQQPAVPHLDVIPDSFMKQAYYYAFVPREGDIILALDPNFIDLFEPEGLEEILSDPRQMTVKMSELTALASAYGYASDHTWIGFQVTRIEQPTHTRKATLQRIPLTRDHLSKVIPVSGGNRLAVNTSRGQDIEEQRVQVPGESNYPRLSGGYRIDDEVEIPEPERIKIKSGRPSSAKAQMEGEERAGILDRIKLMEFDKTKGIWNKFLFKITHLFPASRSLSVLALIAIVLVILVLLVTMLQLLTGGNDDPRETTEIPTITEPVSDTEGTTPPTDFEIKVTVRAQSMQIMAAPGATELVATAVRGDTVYQLTQEDQDGWVMVRLSDGRTGYVPLSVLIPDDTE